MRRFLLGLGLSVVLLGEASAFEPFRVDDIRVEGLQRTPVGTVLNYLPVQVGDSLDPAVAEEAIRSLYRTGFFQDVALRRDGQVLVVEVAERPSIANIDLRGNDAIGKDDLTKALEDVGLAEGRVFNRFLLNDIERELRRQYLSRGHYDIDVTSTVSPLDRNRVGIRIEINEGEQARIRSLRLVGNRSFGDERLLDLFELGPKSWYHLFSNRDEYARERLAADLERLRSFYLDRGFINFTITSTQVAISPDRQSVYVTVNVAEGDQVKVGEVKLAGDLVVGEPALRELLRTEPGQLYSRRYITDSVRGIRERLGDEGYAFANVNAVPTLDDERKVVDLTYFVDPGKRVYVRRINITGNERTQDEVIRREMRQMEGAWLSSSKLQRSRQRLDRLGFFESVNIETPPVPGEPDQVDVNVGVTERLSGSLQAGLGYGDSQGVMFNLSLHQDNLLGTGDRLGLSLNNSEVNRIYSVTYTERFHTMSGITRTLFASHRETDAQEADLSDYNYENLSVGANFSLPLSEDESISFGLSYEHMELILKPDSPATIVDFVNDNGDQFDSLRASLGWTDDTRNRAIFPSRGGIQNISAQVTIPGSDLEYYKLSYRNQRWIGLSDNLTLSLEGSLAYGDSYGETDKLPFFENYYAGGISSVRGYRSNWLGPRNPDDRRPFGGNARILVSGELIFPVPFTEIDSMRMVAFVDGGQVYDTSDEVDLGEIRYSTGIGAVWLSPLGALTFSLGYPLNDQPGDRTERFQFSLGSSF